MKTYALLAISLMSIACIKPQIHQKTNEDIKTIVNKIQNVDNTPNQWQKTYPSRFFKLYPDLRICPSTHFKEHLKETNSVVIGHTYIDNENTHLGNRYKIRLAGKSLQRDKIPLTERDNPLSKPKLKSGLLVYDIVFLTAKDKKSQNLIKEKYPDFKPPGGLNCINCDKSDEPLIFIYSNTKPRVVLYLTDVDDIKLTFSSSSNESIIIRPYKDECPDQMNAADENLNGEDTNK